MNTIISSLNSLCGSLDAEYLTDYTQIFQRKYVDPIFCSSLERFHLHQADNSRNSKICFRGTGHSMHGRSLPSPGEELIATCKMNNVTVLDAHTLEVDCGVQIGALNAYLNKFNCYLPVVPLGCFGGPSMAGYFLAGGIGEGSINHGGFWANVDEILWTDLSTHKKSRYTQSDSIFWEISGSGGSKYGFLEQLRIRFFSLHQSASNKLPVHFSTTLVPHSPNESTVWWTVFCEASFECTLMRMMRSLMPSLNDFVSLVPPRRLMIKKVSRYPDFLNSFEEPLYAISIGGHLIGERLESAHHATALIEEFCNQRPTHLIPYSSSELSLKSFLQS